LGYLKRMVSALQRQVDPTESLLKSLARWHGANEARQRTEIEVLFPAKLSVHQVRSALPQLVAARTRQHQYLLCGSALLLPVTLAMGFLPGPNVFFAWNVYRLYSHFQALRGGRIFLNHTGDDLVCYSPSQELEDIVQTEERSHRPLNQEQIAEISARFGLKTLAKDIEHLENHLSNKRATS